MRIIRGLHHLESSQNGCVLTIGNFDGLHLGHRAVIEKLAERGNTLNLPVVVMIFEPQPLEYFLKDNAPPRLTRLREKVIQFAKLPVDVLLIAHFNEAFANMDAGQFVDDILIKKLNIKYLVVGDDFHFGKARLGNFAMLKDKGRCHGFYVEDTGSYLTQGLRVSSTLIRDALAEGNLIQAEQLLGRAYSICGRVEHGGKRGRTIGFPTANIKMCRKISPIHGVFAVTITGIDDLELFGIANVGTRPTVEGSNEVILETHLFNFDKDIYGRYIEVHFKHKIRDELRFESLEHLQTQIKLDVTETKRIFAETMS
jgi:riboflavin kinase / FMN adenylyltransferase